MSKFDTYFLMKTDDAIEYAKEKVSQIEWDADSMNARKSEMETLTMYSK